MLSLQVEVSFTTDTLWTVPRHVKKFRLFEIFNVAETLKFLLKNFLRLAFKNVLLCLYPPEFKK